LTAQCFSGCDLPVKLYDFALVEQHHLVAHEQCTDKGFSETHLPYRLWQSVRDGENSTVCKFSVGNGNDHEDATDLQYELPYRLSNELIEPVA